MTPRAAGRPARDGAARTAEYAAALVVGAVAVALLLPFATVLGTGGMWASPPGDEATTLVGHLAFQADAWRWPLLTTRALLWPRGASVAMADANPALSLLAKAAGRAFGFGPVNLLGFWLAACVLLQPVAAVFALRGAVRGRPEAALATAALAVLFPEWLMRVAHVNLMGQFVVLAALGLVLRLRAGTVRHGWAWATVLLTAALLFHPYLFLMAAVLLASVPAGATLARRGGAVRTWARFVPACGAPLLLFRVLNGGFSGGAFGFGYHSMNLLSPVWPQMSGLFGRALPILDATGGQYEGFNYLGAGVLFLLAAAALTLLAARRPVRVPGGLALVLLGLTVLALSNRVYAGHALLLDLGEKPWDRVLAPVRASGRFFWPVGYALLLGAVAAVATRLPRRAGAAVLAAAVLLQAADAGPVWWHRAADLFAGTDAVPPDEVPLPPGTTLLSLAPSYMCLADRHAFALSASLMLRAVRAGARLGDASLARPPRGFSCEKARADMLELPLLPGEARVFTRASVIEAMRTASLGAGARCVRADTAVVCGRKPDVPAGEALPAAGEALPRMDAAGSLAGAALRPLLSHGWVVDPEGSLWAGRPYATLLFAPDNLPPGNGLRVALRFEPAPRGHPEWRAVVLRAGRREAARAWARDGEPVTVEVVLTPDEVAAGVARLAFDTAADGDFIVPDPPRGVPLRLLGIDLSPAGPP